MPDNSSEQPLQIFPTKLFSFLQNVRWSNIVFAAMILFAIGLVAFIGAGLGTIVVLATKELIIAALPNLFFRGVIAGTIVCSPAVFGLCLLDKFLSFFFSEKGKINFFLYWDLENRSPKIRSEVIQELIDIVKLKSCGIYKDDNFATQVITKLLDAISKEEDPKIQSSILDALEYLKAGRSLNKKETYRLDPMQCKKISNILLNWSSSGNPLSPSQTNFISIFKDLCDFHPQEKNYIAQILLKSLDNEQLKNDVEFLTSTSCTLCQLAIDIDDGKLFDQIIIKICHAIETSNSNSSALYDMPSVFENLLVKINANQAQVIIGTMIKLLVRGLNGTSQPMFFSGIFEKLGSKLSFNQVQCTIKNLLELINNNGLPKGYNCTYKGKNCCFSITILKHLSRNMDNIQIMPIIKTLLEFTVSDLENPDLSHAAEQELKAMRKELDDKQVKEACDWVLEKARNEPQKGAAVLAALLGLKLTGRQQDLAVVDALRKSGELFLNIVKDKNFDNILHLQTDVINALSILTNNDFISPNLSNIRAAINYERARQITSLLFENIKKAQTEKVSWEALLALSRLGLILTRSIQNQLVLEALLDIINGEQINYSVRAMALDFLGDLDIDFSEKQLKQLKANIQDVMRNLHHPTNFTWDISKEGEDQCIAILDKTNPIYSLGIFRLFSWLNDGDIIEKNLPKIKSYESYAGTIASIFKKGPHTQEAFDKIINNEQEKRMSEFLFNTGGADCEFFSNPEMCTEVSSFFGMGRRYNPKPACYEKKLPENSNFSNFIDQTVAAGP